MDVIGLRARPNRSGDAPHRAENCSGLAPLGKETNDCALGANGPRLSRPNNLAPASGMYCVRRSAYFEQAVQGLPLLMFRLPFSLFSLLNVNPNGDRGWVLPTCFTRHYVEMFLFWSCRTAGSTKETQNRA